MLKLEGDVRLTLSTTIDDYLERMFQDEHFKSVLVDLCSAQGVDSTTLGLLAKLALRVERDFGFRPTIYASDPGINRLLHSMAFQNLFVLREGVCDASDDVAELPSVACSEDEVKAKIIEAHRVLMDVSEENRERFTDLMAALEQS